MNRGFVQRRSFKKPAFSKLNHSKDIMNLEFLNDLMPIYCKKDYSKTFCFFQIFDAYTLLNKSLNSK